MDSSSKASDKCESDDIPATNIEADKKCVLESALKTNLINLSRLIIQSQPGKTKKDLDNTTEKEEIEKTLKLIFEDDDDDEDDDEIFENILKKAEEAYKREQALKKKFPYLDKNYEDIIKDIPKRTRKRKSKIMDNTLNAITTFKKRLLEAKTPVPKTSKANSPNLKTERSKLTVASNEQQKSLALTNSMKNSTGRVYPLWKTSANFTPLFEKTVNPKWINKKKAFTPKFSKMCTPTNIITWQDYNNAQCFTKLSPNSNKSTVGTCKTPDTSSLIAISPKRSTTVRFKPSPPEEIPFNSDGDSSISSQSLLYNKNELNFYEEAEVDDISLDLSENSFVDHQFAIRQEYTTVQQYNKSVEKNNIVEDFSKKLEYKFGTTGMTVQCSMKVQYFK